MPARRKRTEVHYMSVYDMAHGMRVPCGRNDEPYAMALPGVTCRPCLREMLRESQGIRKAAIRDINRVSARLVRLLDK